MRTHTHVYTLFLFLLQFLYAPLHILCAGLSALACWRVRASPSASAKIVAIVRGEQTDRARRRIAFIVRADHSKKCARGAFGAAISFFVCVVLVFASVAARANCDLRAVARPSADKHTDATPLEQTMAVRIATAGAGARQWQYSTR